MDLGLLQGAPPPEDAPGYEGRIGKVLETLGEKNQGVFLLHHAILTYWGWPFWSDVVGIGDRHLRAYHHDETLRVEIADPDHPITRGLSPWTIVDETYEMDEPVAYGDGGDEAHASLAQPGHRFESGSHADVR